MERECSVGLWQSYLSVRLVFLVAVCLGCYLALWDRNTWNHIPPTLGQGRWFYRAKFLIKSYLSCSWMQFTRLAIRFINVCTLCFGDVMAIVPRSISWYGAGGRCLGSCVGEMFFNITMLMELRMAGVHGYLRVFAISLRLREKKNLHLLIIRRWDVVFRHSTALRPCWRERAETRRCRL